MKVLLIGRGVIATQYGWTFEKAGNEVEFLVRPGRIADYGPVVHLDILDGRKRENGDQVLEDWRISMTESIADNHDYDLIIISVNHNQLEVAVNQVAPYVRDATVLIFNNYWGNLKDIERLLPQRQVIWGFPAAGGGYQDKNTLKGGLINSVFMESEQTASSEERYRQVVELFEHAGFTMAPQENMSDWLYGHFIMNAAMHALVMKIGSHSQVFQSEEALAEMVMLMREMVPLVRAKGGNVDAGTAAMLELPVETAVSAFLGTVSEGSLSGKVMARLEETGHARPQANYEYVEPVVRDGKVLGVEMPRLMALEQYFTR